MNDFLMSVAPTIASALLGPLGGVAVAGLGKVFGIDNATTKDITKAIESGKLTPDQLADIQKLELQFKNDEAERGFKYSELEFKDRDSARNLAVQTHSITPSLLTWLVVALVLTAEGLMLFNVVPPGADPIILGRILGTMDSALIMVLSFWFGSNSNSQRKTELLAQANPVAAS
jgi:hypothetical protein